MKRKPLWGMRCRATSGRDRPTAGLGKRRSTSPQTRGGGEWAAPLYTALLEHLADVGAHTAMAVIALPNDASEGLHRSLRFERIGTLREVGHKFGRYVDTAWWQRML